MATNQDKSAAAQTANEEEHRAAAAGTTITVPSITGVADALEPKHLLWFGGLAVAGAIGVLEWPVVAAVGVGTYVAERFARSGRR
ncbi:hypothetical protein GCM10027449_05920 [Sinomonas notoginsengisoli]|uniref:hypothetical protein n=1 Tax=Sinomonas notoginsengisoli TaxID=1457311 RepID=UPI001F2EBA1B|nr:hypothetical protein [Sinomonas notoginsengisoli]